MNKEESAIRYPSALDVNIDYIALSIIKLDKYFSNQTAAKKYLEHTGWLNEAGMDKFRERFHPMTICALLLARCCIEVPKTQEIVDTINEKIAVCGSITLRNNTTDHYFAVKANHFFWFGGQPLK